MAVKSKEENGKLVLEIDNGELSKLKDVMKRWSFKDHQALMRFCISLLYLSEEQSVSIKMDGIQQPLAPSSDLLKRSGSGDV
jgi:hypothetical protein